MSKTSAEAPVIHVPYKTSKIRAQKTREETRSKLENIEIQEVNKDPKNVGVNIDQDFIVDGFFSKNIDRIKREWSVRYGPESVTKIEESVNNGDIQTEIDKNLNKQIAKTDKLRKFLEQIPNLNHARIHPFGIESPVNPSQAIEIQPDGNRKVNLNPNFQEQLKLITDKCSDTTLVIHFFDSQKGQENCSNVPHTDREISDYIAICDALLNMNRDKLQLELGNETNVTRKTGEMFDNRQFASHSDAHEYAQFYIKVASELKKRHPNAKLAMAGIACYDSQYIKSVLQEVKQYETQNAYPRLIDTVSVHPYRRDPERGAKEIQNGIFIDRPLTYEQQLNEFLNIAHSYDSEVNTIVGEIGFPSKDADNQKKLERSIDLSKQKGLVTYIYPAADI